MRTLSVVTKLMCRAICSASMVEAFLSQRYIEPPSIRPKAAIALKSVLFPAPLRPSRAVSEPCSKVVETPSSRVRVPYPSFMFSSLIIRLLNDYELLQKRLSGCL